MFRPLFKPMLATNVKPSQLKFPMYGSLKLEGVRAEFTPDGLRTRPMKQFGNQAWLSAKFATLLAYCKQEGVTVEGEIYIHGKTFNEISSICRRKSHPDTGDLKVYLFDVYMPEVTNATFAARYLFLKNNSDSFGEDVIVLDQEIQTEAKYVTEAYEKALELGYEGYVLKAPDQTYKCGRSTVNEHKFLRMKDQLTWDGVVLEIVERFENLVESERNHLGYMAKTQDKDMKRATGMAAVAVVKCADFPGQVVRVTLSRGLTDQDRFDIWTNREDYVGKNIRWVGIPVKGMLPRAPRFDVWRTDLD
jgi:hypothetical protein